MQASFDIGNSSVIRFARKDEAALILQFIRELAEYEGMSDQVLANEELIIKNVFDDKKAEVLFCEAEGVPVGFALFFHNFSTFLGKPGIYLEDLYVRPEMRGRGLGKALLETLCRIADERDCGRVEWACLDWNKSSIDFYRGMGAQPMSEWTVYRIAGERLGELGRRA